MADITVEATAVAYRRGFHQDIEVFKGLEGEMVVDLTDQTLVMCDGETRGGHPMARADFRNTNTKNLATDAGHEGKNLAYADFSNGDLTYLMAEDSPIPGTKLAAWDLTNLQHNTEARKQARTEGILKEDYHLAATNLENLVHNNNSEADRKVTASILKEDYNLAADTGDNIHTDAANGLADLHRDTETYGKPLAYADMSNVNTVALAGTDSAGTGATVTGTPLAYNDFSNVDLSLTLADYELLENKVSSVTSSNIDFTHYPSTAALQNYTAQAMADTSATRALDNITDWNCATLPSDYVEYEPQMIQIDGGAGYEVGNFLTFNVTPSGGTAQDTISLQYQVDEVGENGAIVKMHQTADSARLTFTITTPVAVQDSEYSETVTTHATYNISTSDDHKTNYHGGELLKTDLTNITEALNILKVAPAIDAASTIRIDLDHTKSQVYPITIQNGTTATSITLLFPDVFSATARNAYVYELHITVGDVLPEITWLIGSNSTESNPPSEIRWLQEVTSPVEPRKTALYVFRQQQDKVIANYAGCY
jgi:hypothetical protein